MADDMQNVQDAQAGCCGTCGAATCQDAPASSEGARVQASTSAAGGEVHVQASTPAAGGESDLGASTPVACGDPAALQVPEGAIWNPQNADGQLHLGIDVGSTTVKLAVLNSANQIVYAKYQRHHTDVRFVRGRGERAARGAHDLRDHRFRRPVALAVARP